MFRANMTALDPDRDRELCEALVSVQVCVHEIFVGTASRYQAHPRTPAPRPGWEPRHFARCSRLVKLPIKKKLTCMDVYRDKTTDDTEHAHTHIESRVAVEGRDVK